MEGLAKLADLETMMAEPLIDTLKPYVRDNGWLHHPLVVQMPPVLGGHANRLFEQRTREIAEAKANSNWSRIVWAHERPYRLEALSDLYWQGDVDDVELGKLLPDVWSDCEGPGWDHDLVDLFRESGYVSDAEEGEWWEKRPAKTLTVYRGGSEPMAMSWTLSLDVARWFAARFTNSGEEAPCWKAEVEPEAVLAMLMNRGEREVVLDPDEIDTPKRLAPNGDRGKLGASAEEPK